MIPLAPHVLTTDEAREHLNLYVDLLPLTRKNRPGSPIVARGATVHNTGNARSSADALMHAEYLRGADALLREVSWHVTVDDVRAIQHIPDNERAWHAGPGNGVSRAIEICEHAGIDQEQADARAALLVAWWRVRGRLQEGPWTHRHWTGKDCPRVLLRSGWEAFVDKVRVYSTALERGLLALPVIRPDETMALAARQPAVKVDSLEVRRVLAEIDAHRAAQLITREEHQRLSAGLRILGIQFVRAEARRSGLPLS